MSQGTDSVRTNLAGLRRERGKGGMERRGREREAHQSSAGALGGPPVLANRFSKAIPAALPAWDGS